MPIHYLDTIEVEEKYLHVRGSSSKAAQADIDDKKLEITDTKYNIRKYEDNLIIKIKFNRFKCQVEHKSVGHRERITEIGSKTQMLLHN